MTVSRAEYEPNPAIPEAEPPDLSHFDGAYRAATPVDSGELPDGRHICRIEAVRLDRSRSGDPLLRWDLVVCVGPFSTRHLFKNAAITPASLKFLKGDLEKLGLQLERLGDLPNRLGELVGLVVEVSKRTRGAYENVYFNALLPAPDVEDDAADEIPF